MGIVVLRQPPFLDDGIWRTPLNTVIKIFFCVLTVEMRKILALSALVSTFAASALGGLTFERSNGISLTGADGINFIGASGISLTGADGILSYRSNGITLTGADGITLTGADGVTLTGADGRTYTGPNGITLANADGITLTGADGITLTGADGITLTGADGVQYTADSVVLRRPSGITLTGADGITLTGADGIALTGADGATRAGTNGITLTGADGITLTGADGITLTGADGITLTGADSAIGFSPSGVAFELIDPAGITLTGADGITLTGADGVTLTRADGVIMKNIDGITLTGADENNGIQSVDPELAIAINEATDDSSINAVVAFHSAVTEVDLQSLRQIGILGGTKFRVLPVVYVSGTRAQIIAISRLPRVRSIYGNRTLTLNSDPYFRSTGIQRVPTDNDLRVRNSGMPVSGKNVTVAVMDTGINSQHADLAGRVVQNVRLADIQSGPTTFVEPASVENLPNTDLAAGHGTFVAGVVAASGVSSGGRYSGVAPGAKLLGLGTGDLSLTHVLSGFDYLLDKGASYNVRVVNCSFSANTVFDLSDPVNIATKMLTERGVNIVFSAGNSGSGNGTLNPYAAAPWVIGVGATDQNGVLAPFSSRGSFGSDQQPTLVAPGVNIASLRSAPTTTSVGGVAGADTSRLTVGELPNYTTASGTSFSAPQVSGAIALMLETNPSLRPAEIRDILSRTSTPMPRYFYHEAGAGMLNTYAAVLEAAFPDRHMGTFRSTLTSNAVRFTTTTINPFTQAVFPGLTTSVNMPLPTNVVQASVRISWGFSANDFGLKVFNSSNTMLGESNYLNMPGFTGRREGVVLRNPGNQVLRAEICHTAGIGFAQNVYGALELTQVDYPDLSDLRSLSPEMVAEAEKSLLMSLMLPEGKNYRPNSKASRYELASAFLRAGLVPQYLASSRMYTDTRDIETRSAVESSQFNPDGKLFYDVSAGGSFYPNSSASRLVAAIAFVKAAHLDDLASTSTLPTGISDASSIPAQWRGYIAVALERGFISVDGDRVNVSHALTRLELARALNALTR